MSGSIPIQIRGTPGTGPPVGLQERQLAVEMNNGNLWCGVPVSIDSTGRIMLNPRRIPAGGDQYQGLIKGAGTAIGWADLGARPNDSTAIGANTLVNPGANNTAIGASAMNALGPGAASNTALGYAAGIQCATNTDSVFVGAGAFPLLASGSSEIVIGANTMGHGSQTATIGAASGAGAMTQLWCGGRDLLAIGTPPPFGSATGSLTGLANDGAVHDVCSGLLPPGLWLIVVRTWLRTATSTPWFIYGAGLNTAAGQTVIGDTTAASTAASSVTSVNFNHIAIFRAPAAGTIYGCVMAQNATNSGTYDASITLEPFQLST